MTIACYIHNYNNYSMLCYIYYPIYYTTTIISNVRSLLDLLSDPIRDALRLKSVFRNISPGAANPQRLEA